MINKHLLTISAILFCFALHATDPVVKLIKGAEYQLPKGNKDLGLIGNPNDGYLQISNSGNTFCFQKFSPELKMVAEKTITFTEFNKDLLVSGSFAWNGKYYCIVKNWVPKKNTVEVFAIEIESTGNSMTGTAKRIIVAENKRIRDLLVCISTDSTRLCITGDFVFDVKGKDDKRFSGVWVINRKLETEWSNEVSTGWHNDITYTRNYSITCDKQGRVLFIRGTVSSKMNSKKINTGYDLLICNKGNAEPVVVPLLDNSRLATDIHFFTDYDKNVIIAGYYSKNDMKLTPDGLFLYSVTGDKVEKYKKGDYEITTELLKQFDPKFDAANDLYNKVVLRDIVFYADGTALVIGEEYIEDGYMTASGDSRTTYSHKSIVLHFVEKDGTLKWAKKIGKSQFGSNNRVGLGFSTITSNNITYALFLDNVKNQNITPDSYPAHHNAGYNGMLMSVKINADGTFEKKLIVDTKSAELTIQVAKGLKADIGTLVLHTHVGANSVLGGWQSDGKPGRICMFKVQ